MYVYFVGFWQLKNLADLADEPTLYVRCLRAGCLFCCVRQSAIVVAAQVTRS